MRDGGKSAGTLSVETSETPGARGEALEGPAEGRAKDRRVESTDEGFP